jgi:hypothetical protein
MGQSSSVRPFTLGGQREVQAAFKLRAEEAHADARSGECLSEAAHGKAVLVTRRAD